MIGGIMNFDKIKGYLPYVWASLPCLGGIIVFILAIVNVHTPVKVMMFICSVLMLVLGGLIFAYYFLFGERRKNYFLTDLETGLEYSYLFWEGEAEVDYDLSRGYVVKGEDTAAFLQQTLAEMGLEPKEYNEFIVYWLPQMQGNPYNLITFQQEAYTNSAVLNVAPEPDSLLRIFMVYKALDKPIEIEQPDIIPFNRQGFTVIEWGGCALSE